MDFPVVSLADIDLSSQEFWAKPRDWREGAFKTLRDEAPFSFLMNTSWRTPRSLLAAGTAH